jgi:hypothetical protein
MMLHDRTARPNVKLDVTSKPCIALRSAAAGAVAAAAPGARS